MTRYIFRRLAESLIVLAVMSFLIYGVIGLMPGDPIDLMISADPELTTEDAARLRALYGLDQPITTRYGNWLGAALSGDFGYSRIFAQPTLEVLWPRLWNTVLLMGLSFALALAIAIPAGLAAALKPRSWIDHAINLFAFAGISVPPFWLAILLIILFAVTLGWLPAGGMGEAAGSSQDGWSYLVLPVLTLTLATVGGIIRFVRAAMIEALRQDYVRTARAKGLSRAPGRARPRPAQRHDPGGHDPGAQLRRALLRRADHRDHVRLARHGQDHLRRHHGQRSGALLIVLTSAALGAPLIEMALGLDANKVNLLGRFKPPSAEHWLGTDELGRDLLLRLLYGGQVSLLVGLAAALCAAVIGTVIGLLAGFYGGTLDALLMRVADGVIALPLLPLLIVLAAVDLTKLGVPAAIANSEDASLYRIVILIALVGWTTVARLVRGATLSLKAREFVRAAEALGARNGRIMFVHILPNAVSPIIVATTLSVGNVILLESVLSFLGLGIQPPIPSWGNMLTNAQELIWSAPALAIYPGLLIFVTVIAFNFLGDGLQDALDPRAVND